MKLKNLSERGQALVIIALAAVVLFGFTALAIDGSAKFSDRRHAQNAADTAALAGALSLVNNETTVICNTLKEWECKAFLRAEDNGYDDFTNNEVWVFQCNDPDRLDPSVPDLDCGAYEDNENYIEVIILSHVNTTFARVFGWDQFHNLVQAVTLAKPASKLADGAMIISYDPHPNCSSGFGTGGGSMDISGNANIHLSGGGIFLNSQEACGFRSPSCPNITITGGAGVNSAAVSPIDNIDQDGCTSPSPEHPDQVPLAIPEDVYIPDEPTTCNDVATARNDPVGSDTYIITPGYYEDFPQRSINGNIVGNRKNIIMEAGVYCVGGDISWNGGTFLSLDGSSGVTIYIKKGYKFSLASNSPVTLYASHLGTDYDGYLIIQDGTPTSIEQFCTINGGAYLDIEGVVFAPYCNIKVNGDSSSTAYINAQLVGWHLLIDGGAGINFNYDPNNVIRIKRRVGLMR